MTTSEPQKFKDVRIVHGNESKIILPDGMAPREAVIWLARYEAEQEAEVTINELINAYPLEGARALSLALKELHGFVALSPTPGFWGPTPPAMIGIEVAPGIMEQVPWGSMQIPGVHGRITTGFMFQDNRWHFTIRGTILRKSEPIVKTLVAKVREICATSSIYKGQVIEIEFDDDAENFNIYSGPKFIDVSKVREDELILPENIRQRLETNLFVVVEQTARCRKYEIPIKRGVLFEGQFGVGKTLAATVLSKKCVNNGWTFVYLKDAKHLPQGLAFARNYEPCVVFVEDIESVTENEEEDDAKGEQRGEELNEILGCMDGLDAKTSQIILVLTTNYIKRITKAVLRPGRVDEIVRFTAPDAAAAANLVKLYGRGLFAADVDFREVGEALQGSIPAIIRETVEKARRWAIVHTNDDTTLVVTTQDLLRAVDEMKAHKELLMPDEPIDLPPPAVLLGHEIGMHITGAVQGSFDQLLHLLDGSGNGFHRQTGAITDGHQHDNDGKPSQG